MSETDTGESILGPEEADRRMLLLCGLHEALHGLRVHCVLARNHRLVLEKFQQQAPMGPSGLTNPILHAFLPDGFKRVTTDGVSYLLDDGQSFPVQDPAAAAVAICSLLPAPSRAARPAYLSCG